MKFLDTYFAVTVTNFSENMYRVGSLTSHDVLLSLSNVYERGLAKYAEKCWNYSNYLPYVKQLFLTVLSIFNHIEGRKKLRSVLEFVHFHFRTACTINISGECCESDKQWRKTLREVLYEFISDLIIEKCGWNFGKIFTYID